MSVKEARDALENLTTKDFSIELSALVKSRTPLIYLVSTEERRVIDYFRIFSIAGGYRTLIWDAYNGLINLSNMKPAGLVTDDNSDPIAVLDWILKEGTDTESKFKGNVYVLLDFHRFMGGQGNPCSPSIERRLRTFHRMDSNSVIIMVGPHFQSTPALEKCINVIDFPYPNKTEIKLALYDMVDVVLAQYPTIKQDTIDREEEIVRSVSGLTLPEAESAFAKSVVIHKRIDIPTLLKEKRQIIRKTGVLEFVNTDLGLDSVGGLDNLTTWLKKRRVAFDDDAHAFGVGYPKGVLLCGVPGCGKSLSAKAVAKEYGMPLLRLDFGALFTSLMGDSERNARQALRIAESVSPCVIGNTIISINGKEDTIETMFNLAANNTNNDISVFYDETGGETQRVVYLNKKYDNHILGVKKDNSIQNITLKALIRTSKKEKLIKITTRDGRIIIATKNHLIMDGDKKMKEMKEYKVGDSISTCDGNKIHGDTLYENYNANGKEVCRMQ